MMASASKFLRILVLSTMAAECLQSFVALAGHGFEFVSFTTLATKATAKLTAILTALAYIEEG